MGKMIDKRLSELGGHRILDLVCADEATGLEEPVEAWKSSVFSYFQHLNNPQSSLPEETTIEDTSISIQSEDIVDQANVCLDEYGLIRQSTIPDGILSAEKIVFLCDCAAQLSQSPPSNMLPRTRSVATSCRYSVCNNEVMRNNENGEWSLEHPFYSNIMSSRWLTVDDTYSYYEGCASGPQWGSAKRVIEIKMSLEGSGISYLPGDAIGISVPNPSFAVHAVLDRLKGYYDQQTEKLDLSLNTLLWDSNNKCSITLNELLTYRYVSILSMLYLLCVYVSVGDVCSVCFNLYSSNSYLFFPCIWLYVK